MWGHIIPKSPQWRPYSGGPLLTNDVGGDSLAACTAVAMLTNTTGGVCAGSQFVSPQTLQAGTLLHPHLCFLC
jgi:hypothetical protein